MSKITNIENLRDDQIQVYEDLRDGKMGLREAKERANVAGKILSTAKVQLEYNVYMRSKARIPFLETEGFKPEPEPEQTKKVKKAKK